MSDPTRPDGITFETISTKLITGRLIVTSLSLGIPAVAAAVLAVVISPYFWIAVAVALVLFGWLLWLIPRQVHNVGFAVEENDFVVRKGALFRRLSVVPYGRIQFVDISEGPLARGLGIAQLQLHTASAGTDATVPGLTVAQANALRERLVERGAGQLSGL